MICPTKIILDSNYMCHSALLTLSSFISFHLRALKDHRDLSACPDLKDLMLVAALYLFLSRCHPHNHVGSRFRRFSNINTHLVTWLLIISHLFTLRAHQGKMDCPVIPDRGERRWVASFVRECITKMPFWPRTPWFSCLINMLWLHFNN